MQSNKSYTKNTNFWIKEYLFTTIYIIFVSVRNRYISIYKLYTYESNKRLTNKISLLELVM